MNPNVEIFFLMMWIFKTYETKQVTPGNLLNLRHVTLLPIALLITFKVL